MAPRNNKLQQANKRVPVVKQQTTIMGTRITSGPLPPSSELIGYEQAYPGAADRILTMTEKQQDHRSGLETYHLRSQILESRLGQILAFILALSFMACSAYLSISGKEVSGIFMSGATIISLVTIFIKGKNYLKSNLDKKSNR